MKIDVNFSESINYTKLLFSDLGKLLILAILDVIPIVNFIVVGYLANVIKQPKDSNELPPLENYFDLFVGGLKVIFASIIFMIIPLVLVIPFTFLAVLSFISLPFLPTVTGFLSIVLFLIGIVLAFFLSILLAMALVNMVKHDEFGKAFAFGEIMEKIGKIGWGTYILWLIVIFICGLVVYGIGSIPLIGWILSFLLGPIFGTFMARSASLTYMSTEIPETTPEPPADEA